MFNPEHSTDVADSPIKANSATSMEHEQNYSKMPLPMHTGFLNPSGSVSVMPIETIPATTDPNKLLPAPVHLIDGVLAQEGVLVLGGGSKSRKSFLMIELALAIVTGSCWLGFPCKKGRVLYMNMEVEDSQFQYRVREIALARKVDNDTLEASFDIMRRPRTGSWSMDNLAASLTAMYQRGDYALVIIDPIYMLLDGDENSSTTMNGFVRQVDAISQALGCAISLVHHRAKGAPKYLNVFDRACGSGVLGRYAHAAIDINRLNASNEAMRADIGTRSFEWPAPVDFWYEHPIYRIDDKGALATCSTASDGCRTKKRDGDSARKIAAVENAFDTRAGETGEVLQSDIADYLEWEGRTVGKWIEQSETLEREKRGKSYWVFRAQ